MKKLLLRLESPAENIVLVLFFLIANRDSWLCIFEENRMLFSCQYGTPSGELLLYFVMLGMVLWLIYRRHRESEFWTLWRRNWPLVIFLVLNFVSLIWTIAPIMTGYWALWVTASTLVASYLGMRYRADQWLRFTLYFGIAVIVISWLLLLIIPDRAIMSTLGLVGNWRGAFSHKNYMGAIVAYCSAALLYALLTPLGKGRRIPLVIAYLAAVGLLVGSHSATGVILFVVLNGLTFGWLGFRKWVHLFTRMHYAALGVSAPVLLAIAVINRNLLLGFVGRDTGLTGRSPLWSYLLARLVAAQRLWLGYGAGEPWSEWYFRVSAEYDQHWSFQIANGHNGFVDVLLAFGVVGLIVFLAIILLAIYRLIKHIHVDSDSAYWLVLTLLYVLVANLSISFFFQFETFHWALLVMVLFMATQPAGDVSGISS